MIELTLTSLLMFMGGNFCEYSKEGHDDYKSLLMAYSDASSKYGVEEVKKVAEVKEVVKVENDLEETSTLVNFFQDIKQIAVDKGIKVTENKDNFTLFDDASEV